MIVGKMFFLMRDLWVALFDTLDHTILVFNYFGFFPHGANMVFVLPVAHILLSLQTQHLAVGG